jgi:Domain of unknown function (DUF1918)
MASNRGQVQVGDVIEAHGLRGKPPRRGEIVELLGDVERPRYRVRWDERHESIVYPADGVIVIKAGPRRSREQRRGK